MARFFMAGTNLDGGRAIIRGQDAEHIRVLRMRPGEDVVICDGQGTDYRCRLVRSTAEEAEAEVIEVTPCRAEPSVAVRVFAGYPKGERAELLVSAGESVTKGQRVALVGGTGHVTGPHLHLELTCDGIYYNPEFYLA